jgi:hypothetical protein
MEILTTFVPPSIVFLIVFSAPLFHGIIAAGQAAGRYSRDARARAIQMLSPATAPV